MTWINNLIGLDSTNTLFFYAASGVLSLIFFIIATSRNVPVNLEKDSDELSEEEEYYN